MSEMDSNKRHNFKIWLAVGWLVFTSAMVLWWWSLGLSEIGDSKKYRMLMSEGIFFLFAILGGGGTLIYLLIKDYARHQQLKNFFNLFSHDLKTSITRLRLQAEVLKEDLSTSEHKSLDRILKDINRLDLQLENSLIYSQGEQALFIEENLELSKMIESLRNEWDDLQITLDHDVKVRADRRTFLSVLRNLIQNSVTHGKSQKIQISTKVIDGGRVLIEVKDSGPGYKGSLIKLGQGPLLQKEGSGNGIGLFLCRLLIHRQNGQLEFLNDPVGGFVAQIKLPGRA